MKRCSRCREEKALDQFAKCASARDGKQPYCRGCKAAWAKEKYHADIEAARASGRIAMKRQRALYPERFSERAREWRFKNPERQREISRRQRLRFRAEHPEMYRAHNAVNNAIRDGKLAKPTACESCGASERIHGHHEDYDKPLEVIWLCDRCHKRVHAEAVAA